MSKAIQLLVLDDARSDLVAIERDFSDAPFGVATTTDSKEAMRILAEENIKVVMSDQRMANLSGIDFLAQVSEKYPNVVRILFTGCPDNQGVQDAINIGHIFRFVSKPWRSSALKLVIDQSIEYHDLLAENRNLFELTNKSNEELTEVNIKLTKMLHARKEFAAIASHEIRTALAAVKSTIDLVLGEATGELNDDQKSFLTKIHDNVDKLYRLIDRILQLIKLESREFQLNREPHDFNMLARDVLQEHQKEAQDKGLTLNSQLSENIQQVNMDEDKVRVVLKCMVDNAIQFTDHGEIYVKSRVDLDKGVLEVSVEDTGKGIQGGDVKKIFEKFEQFGRAEKHVGGTGLGLAICKEIIFFHEGKIWVESEYGKGSCFYFTLPLCKGALD